MNLGFDMFSFKQLIFVNSASYAYTQLRIDQHTALFGGNNLGKTSLLNALKLFMLPEVNFRDCAKKFNFRATDGKTYSSIDSFRHYFPEDRTFIILECENPHDDFCIVLHRGKATDQQEYSRIAVPCAYSDIAHLFWDIEAETDDGLGRPMENMTLQGVTKTLRSMGGEFFTDKKLIQERMFANAPFDKARGRFCMLPLRNDAGAREMEAWRKLVHLAFDMSAQNGNTLPDTLSTIIEGQKSRRQEEWTINLAEIVEEANRLREQEDRITRIANATDVWESFDQQYHRAASLRRYAAQLYVDLSASLDNETGRMDRELTTANEKSDQALKHHQGCRTQHRDAEKAEIGCESDVKNNQKNANELQRSIDAANAVRTELSFCANMAAMVESLETHIAEKKEDIEGYDNKEKAREFLERTNRTLQSDTQRAKKLRAALEAGQTKLLDGLPKRDAAILYSINAAFGQTYGELSSDQQYAFTEFARQFHSNDGHLVLGHPPDHVNLHGITFAAYDAKAIREDQESELKSLEKRIKQKNRELDAKRQDVSLSAADIQKKKVAAQQEIDKAKADKNQLLAQEHNEAQLGTKLHELGEAQKELHLRTAEKEQAAETLKQASDALRQAQSLTDDLKHQKSTLTLLNDRLDRIGKDPSNVFADFQHVLEATPCAVTEDALKTLEDHVQELRKLQADINAQLDELLRRKFVPDVEQYAYRSHFSEEQIAALHEQIKALFDTLESQRDNHRHQVKRHNSSTNTQVGILRSAKDQISTFINAINQEMGDFTISNLEAFRLGYMLKPRFNKLLDDLDKADLLGDELQDERVYNKLKDFQADFFNADASKTGVALSLDKVIDTITYEYRIAGTEKWTTNTQSNGTTMMITTNLLAVLMARLMESDANVVMPLVIDEFGSLELNNMRTARDMAEKHHYRLFVAHPNRDAKITQVLEHYAHLGLFHAKQAYSPERTVVYHGACEALIRQGRLVARAQPTEPVAADDMPVGAEDEDDH